MNTRFYNCRICAMTEEEELFYGEVWIEGDIISFVGTKEEADREKSAHPVVWDRQIDGEGNLLLPGFKNAHTHSPMTFLRSYADDMPLDQWLHQQIFPMEAKLSGEDMYVLTKLAILEYVSGGITSVFDMYLEAEPRVQAARECGFRMVLCGPVNDFTSSVQQMEEEYERYNQPDSLISYQLGFHAEYTTQKERMEEIARLASRKKAPVYMHLSETKQEVEACVKRYGVSPVKLLSELGIFDHGGGGFHCVHVSREDMELLQKHRVHVITNPASNMKLASGIAPVEQMLEMGIEVSIGTDGPASNNCLDMFREMFLVTGLQKLYNHNAASLPARQVLRMAAVNGAHAMGLFDCDQIAAGRKADLVLIDLHRPNMQPENHILENIVYSGSKENVALTMVNGQVLYENRQFFIGADPQEIYDRANAIITRMKRE